MQYVEIHDNGYWIANTRVSLDSVVFAFLAGIAPEAIVADCFPVLTLEQVYGAITWYLAHRAEFDSHLQKTNAEFDHLRQATREANSALSEKLTKAQRELLLSRS